MKNHLFTRQNQKNHLFNIPSPFSKKDGFFGFLVLPRKRWFWSQKPTFTSQKDGFPEAVQTKTIFLRGKSWFFYEKPIFLRGKKNLFFQHPLPILYKRCFFWFFGLARLGVQSCGPCGVCFVERQPLRVAKIGIGHERVLTVFTRETDLGRSWGGCVHIYTYLAV